MENMAIVHVVDDDDEVSSSLQWLIESVGYRVETCNNANLLIDTYDSSVPGCLICDIRMPQMSGLELQSNLIKLGINLPIIFITAHADALMAVKAMKSGAFDFFSKPLNYHELLESINKAIKKDTENKLFQTKKEHMESLIKKLTKREHQVYTLMMTGKITKVIAQELEISPHTAELHRIKVMKKTEADSLVELTKLTVIYNLLPELVR